MTTTMPAWAQDTYGGPEVIEWRTIDVPQPQHGELLIKVRATALNAADIRLMRGEPLLVRAAFGLRRPKIPVRGMDVAGTVVAVGDGADPSLIGTEVVGELPGGGLAEFVTAPAKSVMPRDSRIDPATAAAVPLAGGTAWQALRRAGLSSGDRVLVIGASSGVGTFTVQLAADEGAEVWALCGERSRELVESLGADRTFDYRTTAVRDLPKDHFTTIVDIAGDAPLRDLQKLLRPGGSVILVGSKGQGVFGPMGRLLRASLLSIGSSRRLLAFLATAQPEVTSTLLERITNGRITPIIERTWPVNEARGALAHVDSGRAVGKAVVLGEDAEGSPWSPGR